MQLQLKLICLPCVHIRSDPFNASIVKSFELIEIGKFGMEQKKWAFYNFL